MMKDPICGMDVDEKTTEFTSTYQDSSYAFCSLSCKTTFEKNPDKIRGDQEKSIQGRDESACCSHDADQPGGCCSEEETKSSPEKSSCCC